MTLAQIVITKELDGEKRDVYKLTLFSDREVIDIKYISRTTDVLDEIAEFIDDLEPNG